MDPNNDMVYVANQTDNTVSVINGNTNRVTATIGVGDQPEAVAVDPTNDMVYVANYVDDTVSVIDGSSNTVVATIAVGGFWVAVDSSTHMVYVPTARIIL